jgi:hypothetical protein
MVGASEIGDFPSLWFHMWSRSAFSGGFWLELDPQQEMHRETELWIVPTAKAKAKAKAKAMLRVNSSCRWDKFPPIREIAISGSPELAMHSDPRFWLSADRSSKRGDVTASKRALHFGLATSHG